MGNRLARFVVGIVMLCTIIGTVIPFILLWVITGRNFLGGILAWVATGEWDES